MESPTTAKEMKGLHRQNVSLKRPAVSTSGRFQVNSKNNDQKLKSKTQEGERQGAFEEMLQSARLASLNHSAENVVIIALKPRPSNNENDHILIVESNYPHLQAIDASSRLGGSYVSDTFVSVDILLSNLSEVLRGHRNFFNKNTLESNFVPVKACHELTDSTPTNKKFCFDAMNLDGQSLLDACTASKIGSLNIQEYLGTCSNLEADLIGKLLADFVPLLAQHPMGSYVAQRLAFRSAYFEAVLTKFCLREFQVLIHNEYSSRVIQVLIENYKKFRHAAAKLVKANLEECLGSSQAIHIVQACLQNSTAGFDQAFVLQWLLERPQCMWRKGYQKILVNQIKNCSDEYLDSIFYCLKVKENLAEFLQYKLLSFLLAALVLRNHIPTRNAILKAFKRHTSFLLSRKCVKFFFMQLWRDPLSKVAKEIGETLTAIPPSSLTRVFRFPLNGFFYLYMTIKTLQQTNSPTLKTFLVRQDLQPSFQQLHRARLTLSSCE